MKKCNLRNNGQNVTKALHRLCELTSDASLFSFDVCVETLPAGGSSSRLDRDATTDQFIYVLEGESRATRGDCAYDIRDGNYLDFPAGVERSLHNPSLGRARLLIVTGRRDDRERAGTLPSSLSSFVSVPDVGIAEFGRAVRRVARGGELYEILSPWGCGPFDGGCLIVASALQRIAGKGELITIVGRRRGSDGLPQPPAPQHVMLRIGDRYLDADGARTFSAMRSCWFEREKVIVDSVVPLSEGAFSSMDAETPPFSEKAAQQLEQLIRAALRR